MSDEVRKEASAHLAALTAPRSVAIVGASGTAGRVTARPITFLKAHGFAGEIYPVNPGRDEISGLKAYPSLDALPEVPDQVYILLDADAALDAAERAVGLGVPVLSILADGFAEAGPEGLARQERLGDIARGSNTLVIGPNSMGVVDTRSRFVCTTNAAFGADDLPTGRFGVISQSGSVIGTIFSRGAARGLGFSTLVSVGNEALSGVAKIGDHLLADPDCDGLLLFLETIREPEALAQMARHAASLGKPVVAYQVGRSDEGQALAVSHTGAMVGGTQAREAFLRHIGIVQVDTLEALLETPAALTKARHAARRPKRVTVVSTTGGGGAMVIDQLSFRGIEVAGASSATVDALADLNLPIGRGKLVDVTLAGARYEVMKRVIATLIADPETGVVVVAIGSSAQFNPELAVTPIIDAVHEASDGAAPVFAFPLPDAKRALGLFQDAGIPAFRTLEACAEAVAHVLDRSGSKHSGEPTAELSAPKISALPVKTGALDEVTSSAIMRDIGVPLADSVFVPEGEALPTTLPFAFPVVLKAVSADLPHKSEAGGVIVGIATAGELAAAAETIRAAVARNAPSAMVRGLLIQAQASGIGEALIGLTRDPVVGPIVTVGMGGIATEVYEDIAMRPAPVSETDARQMIDEVRGFKLLKGFRGKPAGDLDALARAIASVSRLALIAEIAEAEANPVIVKADGDGVVAVDALITLR
jgi:acyl-CoA synthetase (NDP forming)